MRLKSSLPIRSTELSLFSAKGEQNISSEQTVPPWTSPSNCSVCLHPDKHTFLLYHFLLQISSLGLWFRWRGNIWRNLQTGIRKLPERVVSGLLCTHFQKTFSCSRKRFYRRYERRVQTEEKANRKGKWRLLKLQLQSDAAPQRYHCVWHQIQAT